jgi:hypothetical protein
MLTVLRAATTRIREEIDRALRCGRRDEHLPVKRIERSARAVKTETAFAALANNDAGYFLLRTVDCVSFRHGVSIAEPGRRPLVDELSVCKAARMAAREATRRNNNRGGETVSSGRSLGLIVSWVSLRVMESTKTLRGT